MTIVLFWLIKVWYAQGMGQNIEAVYENGVLKPLEPLRLPEHQRVRLSITGIFDEASDRAVIQRAAFLELESELSKLSDGGKSDPPAITDLDTSIYGQSK